MTAAADCNVVHVGAAQVATGAAEAVLLWNLRQGQEVARMEAPRGANDAAAPRVTCLALSSTRQLAAGYRCGLNSGRPSAKRNGALMEMSLTTPQ